MNASSPGSSYLLANFSMSHKEQVSDSELVAKIEAKTCDLQEVEVELSSTLRLKESIAKIFSKQVRVTRWVGLGEDEADFLGRLLSFNCKNRNNIDNLLKHAYFACDYEPQRQKKRNKK